MFYAISAGQRVDSQFEIVESVGLESRWPQESHVGIAASLTETGLTTNDEIARYWKALGAPESAIWQPTSNFAGAETVAAIVRVATQTYINKGLLPNGATHNIYGEVINFDGVLKHDTDFDPYDDTNAHVDFIPPNAPCAVFFESNQGGTVAWRGSYTYRSNLEPSYDDVTEGMGREETLAGQGLFSPDARTFLHARKHTIDNNSRRLTRIFIGQ